MASYPSFPTAAQIARQEALVAADELSDPDGAKTILVKGGAGSGKSGVIRLLIEQLRVRQITHLAFRADAFMGQQPDDIGHTLTGERESPVTTLQRISERSTVVLIIDQIDAVSEISGRDPNLKQFLLRMVWDANHLPTVRVVCVCRSFDLETDERLKALGSDFVVRHIDVPPLNWGSDVEPVLQARGIATNQFSQSQKSLLCSPLNLSLFLEVGDGEQPISRTDLFQKLLRKVTRDIKRVVNPVWSVEGALQRLALRMSQNQSLQAPLTCLAGFDGAAEVLASSNLIAITGSKANFFHESFFDFLFARHFINSSESVVELLLKDEQHLFRRTQVRQILEVLRQDDYSRYLKETANLLQSPNIRFHIKLVVAQWLGVVKDPAREELEIALALDISSDHVAPLFRSILLGDVGWFDLFFNASDVLKVALEGRADERLDMVLWLLTKTAQARPEQVAQLLSSSLDSGGLQAERFLEWLTSLRGTNIAPQLLALGRRAITAAPDYLLVPQNKFRSGPLLDSLAGTDIDFVVFAIRMYFDAWFDAHPGSHPFLGRETEFDMETLEKLGIRNSAAFLSATIDALCRTIDRLSTKRDSEPSDRTFHYRQFGEQFMPDDKFLALFRNALGTLAQSDAAEAILLLRRLAPTAHPALLHLHLETIAANGAALGCTLVPLLNEEHLFEAGWTNTSTSSFVAAARAARPYLDDAQWSLVEQRILQHHPELDLASSVLARTVNFGVADKREYVLNLLSITGEEVWTVLENIGHHHISKEAQRRLEELRRKFVGQVVRTPEPMRAHIAHSPISHSAALKMSDDDWLHAFDVYLTKPSQSPRLPIGSPSANLAGELLHVAQSEPVRFAALLLRIDDKHPQAYIRNILMGLAAANIKKRTKRPVRAALRSAHSRPGHPYGEAIAAVIEKHPWFGLDDDMFSFLSWYAKHGTSNDKEVQDAEPKDGPVTIQHLLARSEHLYFHALDGQRGAALRAIRAALWHVKGNFPKAWPLLQELVSQEQDASVRVALVSCLAPMIHDDRHRCAELLKELVWKPSRLGEQSLSFSVHVLATNEATNLVAYLLRNEPASGRHLVDALLTAADSDLRLLGRWHIIRASFYFDEYIDEADGFIRTSTDCARLAATCAAHAIEDGELTSRALRILSELLESGDSHTISNAGDVFRNVPSENFHKLASLAHAYITTTSLQDGAFPLLYGLEHATGDVGEIVVSAAEQLVANTSTLERKRRRATDLQQIRALLGREYAASENRPTLRTRILDVLDAMLELDLFGAEDLVQAHERN